MKMLVGRYTILIVPENETDAAYLEEVFGLKKEGDWIQAKRVNAMGLSCIAYIEIAKD